MLFEELIVVGPRNHVLNGGLDLMNTSVATTGNKSVVQLFQITLNASFTIFLDCSTYDALCVCTCLIFHVASKNVAANDKQRQHSS